MRQTRIWCLANMFMQRGKTESAIYTKGPEDTDASLFFKMMRNCKLFEFDGCNEMYENIMEARTKLHHSPTHLVTKEEADVFFERMKHLLRTINEPDCEEAIKTLTQMKQKTMMCVDDTTFTDNAKNALRLHEKALFAEIQNEKSKGYTTDDLERTLGETRDEIENMKPQCVKYGLESRKQLKKVNQGYREKVKEMEVIVENMEKLKQKTSTLKTKTKMIMNVNSAPGVNPDNIHVIMNVNSAPGVNPGDIHVNNGIDSTEAERCPTNICYSIPRDLTCLMKAKQSCTCGRCICQ